MALYDISLPLSDTMFHWPGTSAPSQAWVMRLDRGDVADVSEWCLGSHTGTHLDAPSHFLPGTATMDAIPADVFVGLCEVVDVMGAGMAVGRGALEAALGDRHPRRVLLKTANSAQPLGGAPFSEAYAGLTPDGAQFLIAHDVQLVGNDYLSVEPFASIGAGAPVHHALLAGGVSILEGISLAAVPPGLYFLAALALRLQGSDGSPTRAVLLDVADVRHELEPAA